MSKKRLDELLVEQNLVETIDQAKRQIMAGNVFRNQERLDSAGMLLDSKTRLRMKTKQLKYVSRGGLKLEKAIQYFSLELQNRIMIDIGSSTGGFTDCGLQNGIKLSYAIDVGYNQLDWKLRSDKRVIVMERTNFRYVTKEQLTYGTPSFASIDVSFISLKVILPVLKQLLDENHNDVVALIKPQFEARKDQVGTGGIVRDKTVHIDVLQRIIQFAEREGFNLQGLTYSPITGGEGNIEFLAHFKYEPTHPTESDQRVMEEIVEKAHKHLIGGNSVEQNETANKNS